MSIFDKQPIAAQLDYFSRAFDFYMEAGHVPEGYPSGAAGGFMKDLLNQNPQLPNQDPLWQEMLKEETMHFLQIVLSAFQQLDQAERPEENMIEAFGRADLNGKRQMWNVVAKGIGGKYSPREIDLEAFTDQFADHDAEEVLDSLTKEWKKAFEERKEAEKERLLRQMEQRWRQHIREAGTEDFEARKKMQQQYVKYPVLAEIVKIMGREEPRNDKLEDEVVYQYLPTLLSHTPAATEIEEISAGNDLIHMLPSESAIMSDPVTEPVFYRKYIHKQLQVLSNRPKLRAPRKVKDENRKKPRLEKGPMIVSLDTSGSMAGEPEEIAACLLMELVRRAKKEKRKCYLITFSIRAQAIDLATPGNWHKLKEFLEGGFSGGTDGEEMLKMIFEMLQSKNYEMADALIISDFYFPEPLRPTLSRLEEERTKGTRFYGLQIGDQECAYEKVLDEVWKV